MKKKVAFALCTALMLCSMSVAALAAEPMTDADTVSTMLSAVDTLPGISAYLLCAGKAGNYLRDGLVSKCF